MTITPPLIIGTAIYPGHLDLITIPYAGAWTYWLDGTGKQVAIIFQTPAPITITRLAAIFADSCYGTAPTYRISLQSVGTDGKPSGTIKSSGNAYADFQPTGTTNDNALAWYTLGASYTTAAGEWLAIVITHQSGTCDASNKSQILMGYDYASAATNQPYLLNGNGSWTRQAYYPIFFAYGSADTAYGYPACGLTQTQYSFDSSPNEYALAFQLPSTFCSSFTLRGFRIASYNPGWTKTCTIRLYDSDGSTILASYVWDADNMPGANYTSSLSFIFTDTSMPLLSPDTTYRLSIQPDQASTNLAWYSLNLTNAADADAFPFGQTWYRSTRTNPGAWTDTPTRRPLCHLILDELNSPIPPIHPGDVPAFPFLMIDETDGLTPKTGLTVTAETALGATDFTPCTNAPYEVGSGLYAINLEAADLNASFVTLKFSADGALTQYLTIEP